MLDARDTEAVSGLDAGYPHKAQCGPHLCGVSSAVDLHPTSFTVSYTSTLLSTPEPLCQ